MSRRAMRSSLRSRDSSSTSTGPDPRERVKDCCRKLVAFMCTQVGVGGLIVGYAVVGAFGFIHIETMSEYPELVRVAQARNVCADNLWVKTAGDSLVNTLNKTAFELRTRAVLKEFEKQLVHMAQVKKYDGRGVKDVWTFPAALMFCMSVFTMIGYGNIVPRTHLGRWATVMYAVIGIPLYILYFMNMGKVLAQSFRWLYRRAHECAGKQRTEGERIIVPSTACLWVIFGYVLAGSVTFAQWENWGFLDSVYFCVTSLCKIGMGDFVPGVTGFGSRDRSHTSSQTKLVINFVFLLLGMGLIAMCYNLMREDVRVKARELREFLKRTVEELRLKFLLCCHFPVNEMLIRYANPGEEYTNEVSTKSLHPP
ncbi:TWiK family of potassium channels protein 7 [Neodiprion lecontei]|uniref:TWiK family of potassium channels protein 7 n=1 Tax=Neodiprion lecontei TaxID=441921 RepID=A0A6J0BAH3_NEOLC|nr:TWiK family of potassium channels protein 7 [Neodiprion lecontei]